MSNATYCDLSEFSTSYARVHGPLSFLVCVFGSVANVLNIRILSTKEMRTPTNLILTGLALADLLVMLEYVPFIFHRYLNGKYISGWSYGWAVFMIFHALFTQVCHFISCCLTVILAVWRYLAISSLYTDRFWFRTRETTYVVAMTYCLCPLVCTPLFLSLGINSYNQTCDPETGRILNREDLADYEGPVTRMPIYNIDVRPEYKPLSFWLYGVIIKLAPCVLLTELSRRLIVALCETKRRRRRRLDDSCAAVQMESMLRDGTAAQRPRDGRERAADRTSAMLVAVLLLFLVTELPQGTLGLLSAIVGPRFEAECYTSLGDVMDVLALTNSAINFILYCTMSRQFRTTFRDVFCRRGFFLRTLNVSLPHSNNNGEKTQISAM